jgi:hypothetical protein
MDPLVKIFVMLGSSASIGFGIWHFLYRNYGIGTPILMSMRQSW